MKLCDFLDDARMHVIKQPAFQPDSYTILLEATASCMDAGNYWTVSIEHLD